MDKDFLKLVFKKNSDIVYRVIAGEAILVPTTGEMQEAGKLFTLNETGAFIWESIDGRKTMGEVMRRLMDEYGVEETTAREDLQELVQKLKKIGALAGGAEEPR